MTDAKKHNRKLLSQKLIIIKRNFTGDKRGEAKFKN
jgi:hypothetical protein